MRIDKAKQFIMENARAYERALYRYFFQNGSKDSVIRELRQYQNSDGGFGHGLEADNWNPNSNPIATNDAVITLYRIGALEKDSEIVQSIISYLLELSQPVRLYKSLHFSSCGLFLNLQMRKARLLPAVFCSF